MVLTSLEPTTPDWAQIEAMSRIDKLAPLMFPALLSVIRGIPPGKVCTYGQVARVAGYPGAARQVVWALRSPAAHGLPWHRVVGAGGKILLKGDAGLEQRLRLAAEGVSFVGHRIIMPRHQYNFKRQRSGEARG